MKRKLFTLVAAAALCVGAVGQAQAITLTPGDMIGLDCAANGEAQCIIDTFSLVPPLNLFYKNNVGGLEEGPFADDYETEYSPTDDPNDALITWGGPGVISCPSCYLAVKDGQSQIPNLYVYDLDGWDGMESIELLGFWPNQGAISHVSIWGLESSDGDGGTDGGSAPEPGLLLMFGAGLIGMAGRLRKA